MHCDFAFELLDQLLGDAKTKADPLRVHLCCTQKFPKLREQEGNILLSDSSTGVLDFDLKHLAAPVVTRSDFNLTSRGELESILDQVGHNLQETTFITDKSDS